ncbi:beta strand repeat-containing protein [Burkholderia multivorans]|uniref:beta strand repeat-containing protein n=1 Tax=Burkholderia multivorans TaxID=87883 RepID=UPI001C22149A|nr:hypothetical protein [Burkholderia multivorans]MBU9624737.1 hypothetical protein [Burkholderia multivorans]
MKKILLALLAVPAIVFGQTYPSPTFSSLTLQNPLTVSNGGTSSAIASGVALDNITGFSGIGFVSRTGAGSYSFVASTGSGNVVLSTSPTLTTPNLGTPTSVTLTNGTGLPVSTGISGLGTGVAAGLANAVTGTGGPVLSTSPALSGTPTAPTAAIGTRTTQIATTDFVATHAGCKSILDYGGNNGGSVDNSAAFVSAAAASPSGQACVYFPPGVYAFSSQFVYSLPTSTASITIEGAGADVSILKWAAGGGFQVNYSGPGNSAHIRNLSIVTGTTATGNGLVLYQNASSIPNPANSALSEISGVAIRGSDGYAATNYWNTGIYISGVSNVNIVGSSITGQGAGYTTVGTGISIIGTSAAQGVQYNIVGSAIQYVGTGLLYGNYVQGVAVAQSNFTGDNYGIVVNTPAQGQDQLTITGSQFNCKTIGIYDQIGIAGLSIYGNYIIVPYTTGSTVAGVQLASVFGASITSNVIQRIGSSNTNTNGVIIQGGGTIAGVITGNVLANLYTGIWLTTASSNINVQSNAYTGNTNSNVLNQGTGNTVGGGSP